MTPINTNIYQPLPQQPVVTPAPADIPPHESVGTEEIGSGTGAYYEADSAYYTSPDEPNLIPQPTTAPDAPTLPVATTPVAPSNEAVGAPTLDDFAKSGLFTAEDIAKIARLTPSQATVLLQQAVAHAEADARQRAASQQTVPTGPVVPPHAPTYPTTAPAPPATPTGTVPTMADIEKLGVFTPDELTMLAKAGLTDAQMVELHTQASATAAAKGPDTGAAEPGATGEEPPKEVKPLTAAEKKKFPAAVKAARAQLDTKEVRESIRAELKKAGMPSTDADVEKTIKEISASYDTPEGARQLMDMVKAEKAAKPGWNASWKEKFTDAITPHGVSRQELKRILEQYEAIGLPKAELAAVLAELKGPDGGKMVKDLVKATKPGWNDKVEGQIRADLKKIGLEDGTIGKLIDQFKAGEPSTASIKQTRAHLATPEGAKEMKQYEEALKAGAPFEIAMAAPMYAVNGGMALYAGHVGMRVWMGKNPKSVADVLAKVAAAGGTDAKAAIRGLVALDTPAAKTALKAMHGNPGVVSTIFEAQGMGASERTAAKAFAGRMLEGHAKAAGIPWSPGRTRVKAVASALNPELKVRGKNVVKLAAGFGTPLTVADDLAAKGGAKAGLMAATKGAKMGARLLPGAGIVVGVGLGAMDIHNSIKAEGGVGKESSKVIGNVSGFAAGAAIGAGVGVWFGGVGAVPGAIIGSLIVGLAGSWAGEKAGEGIHNAYMAGEAASKEGKKEGAKEGKKKDRPEGGVAVKL